MFLREGAVEVFGGREYFGNPDAPFSNAFRLAQSQCFWQVQAMGDDQVHIEQLEVLAHIGVPEEERAAPQRLTFNLTFWPIRQAAEMDDDIGKAVNYATVCSETRKFVESRGDKLVETVADALARHLLDRFEIRKITIELRKYILPETDFISITVTREKGDG
ncbi:MAG TPA: dihydroneopterin aldolase [Chthoniobacterales bacterium]|nr:dihydroneopterin aldolase [Chthoniobacterales bacterium]